MQGDSLPEWLHNLLTKVLQTPSIEIRASSLVYRKRVETTWRRREKNRQRLFIKEKQKRRNATRPTSLDHGFVQFPEDPSGETCKMITSCEKRADGLSPLTAFGDLITADHKILNDENVSSA